MRTKKSKRGLALPALCAIVLIFMPAARAQGSEAWQKYLDQSPVQLEEFASEPLSALHKLLPEGLAGIFRTAAQSCAAVLLFLLLAAALSFLLSGTQNCELIDLAAAGGCGVLMWDNIAALAQAVCDKIASWQTFLLGFLPVYAGVLTASGETAAAASVGGLLLSALCLLAQAIGAWLVPLLDCYLALSVACCVTTQTSLASACKMSGRLLRQSLGIAGKAFVLLLGVQRVFTAQLDSSTVRMGRLLTGTIPVIGQTLSDAAESVLAGLQMLKSGLGFAAMAVLGAEFLPLYIELLLQSAMLVCCGLLCDFAGIERCKAVFECFAQAVQCMAAATALFFGIAVFGTVIMFAVGGG